MFDNPIEEWYKKDKRLSDLLVSIDEQNLSDEDAAKQAFYKVTELYKLPKFPEDVDTENDEESRSVFEEMAILKFMFPDDELKGIVMLAAYNTYTKEFVSIDEAASIHYNGYENIPKEYFVYYFGKDIDARIEFDIKGQSWIEAGAIKLQKVISI